MHRPRCSMNWPYTYFEIGARVLATSTDTSTSAGAAAAGPARTASDVTSETSRMRTSLGVCRYSVLLQPGRPRPALLPDDRRDLEPRPSRRRVVGVEDEVVGAGVGED